MAHYAKVIKGKVVNVIVAEKEYIDNLVDTEAGQWIQTSYNTKGGKHYVPNTDHKTESDDQSKALRKNYAAIGYHYDGTGFYAPQPYASWVFDNATYLWNAPITMPDDGKRYIWDEDAYQADSANPKTKGWVAQ